VTSPREAAVAPRREKSILRILVMATFVVILNETIMVNAIPRLMAEFEVTARAAQWLSTAFMLSMAVVIPATGWLLQRVTTRRAFLIAMGLFFSGTVLASLAWSFPVLLAARVIQASGTAVMMPLLMTTLLTIVAVEERGKVMGNVTLVIAVAPALGPAVSGLILQLGSWRLIFGVTLPIALAMIGWGLKELVNLGEPRPGTIDWASIVLAALGFGSLIYGLSQVGADSASGGVPAAPAVGAGVLAIATFVWRQLRLQRTGTPLLDLRTLRFRNFAIGLTVMCMSFMALMGAMITLPIYLQSVHGYSTLTTGLLLMPGGLVMGLLGPQVGRLFDRHGARMLVVPGAALMTAALVLLTRVSPTTPAWWLLSLHVLLSVGLALIFTPVFTAGLADLPPHLYAHGSAVLGTLQQVAAAVGTAVVVTVLATRAASLTAEGSDPVTSLNGGIQWGFVVGSIVSALVLGLAFLMPNRPASPSTGTEAPLTGSGDLQPQDTVRAG